MYGIVIAKNTLYQVGARLTSAIVGFCLTILIIMFFGKESYGDFAKITAYVALFYLFVDFGMNAVFLKRKEDAKTFTTLVITRCVIAGISVAVLLLLLLVLPSNSHLNMGIPPRLWVSTAFFALTVFCYALSISAAALFQKRFSYQYGLFAALLGAGISVFGVLAVIFFKLPFLGVFLSYVIGNAVAAGISLFLARERVVLRNVDMRYAKTLLKQSAPLGLLLLSNLLYFRIDIVLLSFLRPTQDVAVYAYAYRYFDFLLTVPLFLSNALYPLLLKSRKNTRIFSALVQKYSRVYLFIAVLATCITLALSPFIGIIGHGFSDSILLLRILSISLPFFFLTSLLQWVLITTDQQGFLLKLYALVGVGTVMANLLLIPTFGSLAAAWITVGSEAVVLLGLFIKWRQSV